MRTVINKTHRPIKISLPRGKTLHLGPSGRGQVHDDAVERPAFKKLIEAGDVEVLGDEGSSAATGDEASTRIRRSARSHPSTRNVSRRGDR